MFRKILIANRGEIACRIIKTAHRLGIETVAVYSEVDRHSLHVQQATHAVCIGEAQAIKSYLNIEAIINAALTTNSEAIHPGYGFLSENPQFAEACEKANLVFIGPSVDAIKIMASKQLAKQLLEQTNVPLTPGYHGDDVSDERLLSEAVRIGFPVLLKAAAGGGGKGMREVHHENEFIDALASARREAKASFNDDTLLIEKLITNPRHIEIQIMADNHGHVVHLYERDCSIQRRHQKIIEEAPAPGLPNATRHELAAAAMNVARAIHYKGAGTVEFLMDSTHQFYFMEMNTRLQVEHPTTEMITGMDLVEWQLKIAAGEQLPAKPEELHMDGHAIECRIYAEDPREQFIPSIGHVHFLKEPHGDGIRIDTGITQGAFISMHYDPMIAKLIAWGKDREQAIFRLRQALKHYHLGGVKTNISFLQAILNHPRFIEGDVSTAFLAKETLQWPSLEASLIIDFAAAYEFALSIKAHDDPLLFDAFSWQMHGQNQWRLNYFFQEAMYERFITPVNTTQCHIKTNDESTLYHVQLHNNQLVLDDGRHRWSVLVEPFKSDIIIYTSDGVARVTRYNQQQSTLEIENIKSQLVAPMPSTVVAVLKQKGDVIKKGERLMILEAMKMEHPICAPYDGIINDLLFEVGAQVQEGAELLTLKQDNP